VKDKFTAEDAEGRRGNLGNGGSLVLLKAVNFTTEITENTEKI
jgi:hypothetical protein